MTSQHHLTQPIKPSGAGGDPALYRPCVGLALFNQQGHVFVGKRKGVDDYGWQMPQGGIDKGEAAEDAAIRELREETGVTSAELVGATENWLYYDLPQTLSGKLWKGKFRGQRQRWFALRFMGSEAEVVLDGHHEQEFTDWRWVPLADTVDLIIPFKRDVYVEVIRQLEPIIHAQIKRQTSS